jgi:hypothetical protein
MGGENSKGALHIAGIFGPSQPKQSDTDIVDTETKMNQRPI